MFAQSSSFSVVKPERLEALAGRGAKIVCCEQYHRYPILAAGLEAVRRGDIGTPQSAYISLVHDYHAASLLRRALIIGGERYEIFFIRAKGHTNGNSLVIAESDGLFYMFEGDITYVDEALYQNKLSVVFDDLAAARDTLNRVREFVRNHPTVYMGTHTPQGYENLEAKRVMNLDNPVPTVLAEVDFTAQQASGRYVCSVCGYVYDPAEHDGVAFEDLPEDWRCPRCRQPREKFNRP